MRSRDAAILFVPGLGGSGPEHWQSRWQAKLPTAQRVTPSSWTHPVREDWCATIVAAIAAATAPVVVVAHSLGVVAFVEAMTAPDAPMVAGAYLVAPPSEATLRDIPEVDPAFTPFPTAPLPCPSVLVGSRDDPYAAVADVEGLALDWGSRFVDAGEAGHINDQSGHGPWPEGLMAFAGFMNKLRA